ncbi:four helix bundle protein [Roseiflexus castenholzii]|uniref:four helix bundle protein n=1 Tax=Roseiflexus castenholzii TaxID=120962 RepID=UPI003C7D4BA7
MRVRVITMVQSSESDRIVGISSINQYVKLNCDLSKVCARKLNVANLAEAWRRRRYEAAFPANLNDAEAEASEVQTGIERAFRCGSINQETAPELDETYEPIIGPIVTMIRQPGTWTVDRRSGGER